MSPADFTSRMKILRILFDCSAKNDPLALYHAPRSRASRHVGRTILPTPVRHHRPALPIDANVRTSQVA